jgi:hypothetical protein
MKYHFFPIQSIETALRISTQLSLFLSRPEAVEPFEAPGAVPILLDTLSPQKFL